MKQRRNIIIGFSIGLISIVIVTVFFVMNKKKNLTNIANPASVNCQEKGGSLVIEKDKEGGEYGACFFEDGRVCEEWALMRGECPIGGLKVTGYTEQERYCAIRGGTIKQHSICILKDGTQFNL